MFPLKSCDGHFNVFHKPSKLQNENNCYLHSKLVKDMYKNFKNALDIVVISSWLYSTYRWKEGSSIFPSFIN